MAKSPWAVCFKEVDNGEIEYSIVRIDNPHGFKSWGWIEPDRKEIVGCSRDADYKYPEFLKERLRVLTVEYAQYRNLQEGNAAFNVLTYEENNKPKTSTELVAEAKDILLRLDKLKQDADTGYEQRGIIKELIKYLDHGLTQFEEKKDTQLLTLAISFVTEKHPEFLEKV